MSQPDDRIDSTVDTCHLFVDEAGSPDLFDAKGREIVGTESCSRYFILGMLEVHDPAALSEALVNLRKQLIADSYFSGAYSFRPDQKKTAIAFHAKDDLPEVRVKVFDLLRSFGEQLHFRAVVCDKSVIIGEERQKREDNATYRYNPDHLYDRLTHALLTKFTLFPDRFVLDIAKRGNKSRSAALQSALEAAETEFAQAFGFSRGGPAAWRTRVTNPVESVCLQAADYFLWALQRFYEARTNPKTGETTRETRYLAAMWPQFSQVLDLHFGPARGTFFNPSNPLCLDTRFPDPPPKRKKPHV